jgi:hypothetical protein
MALQPSTQVSQALERALKRLKEQYAQEFAHLRAKDEFHSIPSFSVWALGHKVLTVDELELVIKSSQLFNSEFEVLNDALVAIAKVSHEAVKCLSIGSDPNQLNKPVIVVATLIAA